MRGRKIFIALALVLLLSVPVLAQEITVAAAANLQFTIAEIKAAFEKETGISVETIIGSSGKLAAQIENGAPFDIFLSADEDTPRRLYRDGITVGKPKIYAYGALVLWTTTEAELPKDLSDLAKGRFKKIAIASPKLAPYGRQAVNALKFYQLYPGIEKKLVYGESIAQVNQFIVTQAADIGITSKSIVVAANMKGKGRWVEVAPEAYKPIAQAVVMLKHSGRHAAAVEKFYDFLFALPAQDIFKKYGYTLP